MFSVIAVELITDANIGYYRITFNDKRTRVQQIAKTQDENEALSIYDAAVKDYASKV